MGLGIVELMSKIGDDKITFQNLDQCTISADWTRNKGTKITFGTEEPLGPNGTKRIGLVVWLDRAEVAEIVAAHTTQEPHEPE